MPSYKLLYFNARYAAEVSRFIMAYGDIPYEDVRLEGPQWQKFKPKSPYGALPVLEVDGKMLCQSKTISRYLAGKAGLMGDSDLEAAKVNMVVECVIDFLKPVISYWFEEDADRKEELGKKVKATFTDDLKKLENLVPAGSKHFVGNKMTWADLETSYSLDMPGAAGLTISWKDFPRLKAVKDNVESHPKIANWIANRPKTDD